MNYTGLTIKNGRLINERPNGMTGIQEASMIRKEMKNANKVQMMAEAVAIGMVKAESIEYTNPMMRDRD